MFKSITDYFSGVEFNLWNELTEMWSNPTDRTWFLASAGCLLLIIIGIVFFAAKRRRIASAADPANGAMPADTNTAGCSAVSVHRSHSKVRALSYGALCISLSFVLSFIKLFSMPQCGSVTLLSMLPLALYAYWFGPAYGIAAGVIYGVLQMFQENYVINWIQPFLDYIFAFGCFGIVGFFRPSHSDRLSVSDTGSDKAAKKYYALLIVGILVAGACRLLCSTLSGAIFFAEYAWEGWNVWLYSFVYNFLSIGIDVILCAVVTALPPVRKTVFRLRHIALSPSTH